MAPLENIDNTDWDVIISGTGLSQSLLALALSRSDKKVLHIDQNPYYGGPEAALSLQEADEWAIRHGAPAPNKLTEASSSPSTSSLSSSSPFSSASFSFSFKSKAKEGEEEEDEIKDLAFSRAYSLPLGPQIVYARSELLAKLVSSRAFRQLDFLVVGSFFVYTPASSSAASDSRASLSRVPCTREDVFDDDIIPPHSKRLLMKFLRFVLDYDTEANRTIWEPQASAPLATFLAGDEIRIGRSTLLCRLIMALTLSLDGDISVAAGLAALRRHLTSVGVFGPGFAAVYAKWGGISEIVQVACRAGAVGGSTYMLNTHVEKVSEFDDDGDLQVLLSDGSMAETRFLINESNVEVTVDGLRLRRLTAVVDATLATPLFEPTDVGCLTPAVVAVAFPQETLALGEGNVFRHPVYAMVHSSDTGQCPDGQSIVLLSTIATPESAQVLDLALSSLLEATTSQPGGGNGGTPRVFCRLAYEQHSPSPGAFDLPGHVEASDRIVTFAAPSVDLAFDDAQLGPVKRAWRLIVGEYVDDDSYMSFADREGADDYYDDDDDDDDEP